MSFEIQIRDLALNFYWQRIYGCAKEINGIHLFENSYNFSGLQVTFLYWLEVYNSLYRDLALGEYPNLTEKVIKDHRRCDAFLYWRQKDSDRKLLETRQEQRQSQKSLRRSKGQGKSYRIFKGVTGK